MLINPSISGNTLVLPAPRPVSQAWQVGQVLQALVVAPTQQGRTTIEIAGTRMTAETNLRLRAGQSLRVRVENSRGPVSLRLLDRPPPRAGLVANTLRQVLPRQLPLSNLTSNLAFLEQAAPEARATLPPEVARQVARLQGSFSEAHFLEKPDGLRRALLDSGTFFETRLAAVLSRGDGFPQLDLKGQLIRLAAVLMQQSAAVGKPLVPEGQAPAPTRGAHPSPPPEVPPRLASLPPERLIQELDTQVRGALARVTLNQLNSVTPESGAPTVWFADLPVRTEQGQHVWSLRVEGDPRRKQEQGQRLWSVSLAFSLEPLGPVQVRISLAGRQVSVFFWSQRPDTAELLNAHFPFLIEQMREAGLEPGEFHARQGEPPPPSPDEPLSGLLDIQA